MTINKYKWNRLSNAVVVEVFYYTDKGTQHREGDIKYMHEHHREGCALEYHPARIVLYRKSGRFNVEWSTNDMPPVDATESLSAMYIALKTLFDGLQSGKAVDDIDQWDHVIYWDHYHGPAQARQLVDSNGKVIRFAPWSERQEQFVPETASYYHNHSCTMPFSEKAWKDAQAFYAVEKAFKLAESEFEGTAKRFKIHEGDSVHLDMMRTVTTYFIKWTARMRERLQAKDKEAQAQTDTKVKAKTKTSKK